MEELFRFYAVRAPESLDPEQSISLDTQSDLQNSLREARGSSALQSARQYLSENKDRLKALVRNEGNATRL